MTTNQQRLEPLRNERRLSTCRGNDLNSPARCTQKTGSPRKAQLGSLLVIAFFTSNVGASRKMRESFAALKREYMLSLAGHALLRENCKRSANRIPVS